MSDLTQVQALLANLSNDIEKMTQITSEQLDVFMGALDDIAAHTLAVQAIIINIMKKVSVDPVEVEAWITENTRSVNNGNGAEKAKALAAYLITGKAE